MATVNKDFRVKNGLIVEGSSATVDGFDVLTKATDDQNYIIGLIGGSATSANTADSVVLRDANGSFAGGTITAETGFSGNLTGNVTGNVTGTVSSIANHDTDDLAEGLTNLYHTDARVRDALSGGTGIDFNGTTGEITVDSTVATKTYADTAEADAITAANSYTDGEITTLDTSLKTYADTAEADAISTANANTDALIGDGTVDGTAGNTVTDRIASAVSGLVDTAPAALDTLNELAAALGDDANFATTVATDIGTKVSKSGDTMTGELVLSGDPTAELGAAPKQYVDLAESNAISTAAADATTKANAAELNATTAAASDATTKADAAESNANSFTTSSINALDTDDIEEGTGNLYFTDARAVTALEAVVPDFTEVDVNSVATQVAATVSVPTAGIANAHQFARADYDSAEYIVKVDDGTNTEVSKILLTLDSSNNIAITEYGIVGTSGALGTVSATTDGTNVTLQVTTSNDSSNVSVSGTLIK